MIYNERDIRNQTVKRLAEAVMAAARTAPKAKGRDLVEVAMITDEDIERLSQTMLQMSAESGMKFLLRDAANVLEAEAVIVVGIIGVSYTEQSADVNRKQRLGKRLAVVAFAMPFCYAIIDALGSFLDIFFLELETSPLVGVNAENIELVANISYELTFAICGIILLAYMMYKRVKFDLPKQKDKALAAVCETAGQLTYVYAMSGNGAIAAPIISCVCVVSLLLSRIFLKEKLTKKQYLFIGIIIVGILMLAVLEGE